MSFFRKANRKAEKLKENLERIEGVKVRWPFIIVYTIPMDNVYVIMQMIMFFLLLIVSFIYFITTKKAGVVDTIEDVKSIYINAYLISMVVIFVLTAIAYAGKKAAKRALRICIVLLISVITMCTFFFIRCNFDSKYNAVYFDEIYQSEHPEEQNTKKDSFYSKKIIDVKLTGAELKTEKEYYTSENLDMYNIFKIKTYIILGAHLIINILLFLQIIKISKMDDRREQLEKDDAIVYDPEQNVHF